MTEEELLRDPNGFAQFYRRHSEPLTAFFVRRTQNVELAADLVAETFAEALGGLDRFDPARGPAVAWLYGIARNQLGLALRRGRVEDRARRSLGMEPLQLTDLAIERIERLAASDSTARALRSLMDDLPADQRAAVNARIIDEREYADIALATGASEPVIRQRVSRALARLRSGLKEGAL